MPEELEVADGVLVELGELEHVRRLEVGGVHRLAGLAAEQAHDLLVRAVQGVRVGPEQILLRQRNVEFAEACDDLVVPQDGEAVGGCHGVVEGTVRMPATENGRELLLLPAGIFKSQAPDGGGVHSRTRALGEGARAVRVRRARVELRACVWRRAGRARAGVASPTDA